MSVFDFVQLYQTMFDFVRFCPSLFDYTEFVRFCSTLVDYTGHCAILFNFVRLYQELAEES